MAEGRSRRALIISDLTSTKSCLENEMNDMIIVDFTPAEASAVLSLLVVASLYIEANGNDPLFLPILPDALKAVLKIRTAGGQIQ